MPGGPVSLLGAVVTAFISFIFGIVGGYFAGYFTPRSWDEPLQYGSERIGNCRPIGEVKRASNNQQALLVALVGLLSGGLLMAAYLVLIRR